MSVPFIAEVSSNHQQDLERCFTFIESAAAVGCAGIKFQLFRIEQLFTAEVLAHSESHRRRKAWQLPTEFIPEIAKACQQHGLLFGCTPFYLDAVAEL